MMANPSLELHDPMIQVLIIYFIEHIRSRKSSLQVKYQALENSPKKVLTLIGLKSCLYNSMET